MKSAHKLLKIMFIQFMSCSNPDDPKLNKLVRKNVKMAAIIGKSSGVSKLSDEYKKVNWGRFVAINYKGTVLKVADTLVELNNYVDL